MTELDRKLYEERGLKYTFLYKEKFGEKEPICYFPGRHQTLMEDIAKECVEKGKTATELGYYNPNFVFDEDIEY